MKDIGARIREARLAKNLKQEDLATLVGVKSLAAVSSWERGVAKPDCMVLKKICEILDVSPDQLLGYNGDTPTATEWNTIKKYRTLDEYGKKAVNGILDIEYERALAARANKQKARMLKLDYYSLPVSAGTGNFLDSEEPEEIYVEDTPEAEEADFVVSVSGNSMEPTYHDGDKVLVSKQDSIDFGAIGIFIVNGEAFIKALGVNRLISHNESYKPIALRQGDSVYCCGKVIGVAAE